MPTDSGIRGNGDGHGRGEDAARKVFADVRGLIHSTLTGQYGISEAEARLMESDLELWFVRFCRRNPDGGPSTHVVALFSLACSFGSSHERPAAMFRIEPEEDEEGFENDDDERHWVRPAELSRATRAPRRAPRLWDRIRKLFPRSR